MTTKKFLTDAMVENIIAELQHGNFVQTNDAKYIPRVTAIDVDEDYGPIYVSWRYLYPGRSLAPMPTAFFTISIGDLSFKIDDGGIGELGEWSLMSDKFSMPESLEVLNKLTSALRSFLNLDFDPLYYLEEYTLENEWTEEEIAEEIENNLNYNRYVYINGQIFPDYDCDSIEEWFESYGDEIPEINFTDLQPPKKIRSYNENKYCFLTPKEAANFLSRQDIVLE